MPAIDSTLLSLQHGSVSQSAELAVLVFLALVLLAAAVVFVRWVWPIAVVSGVVYLVLHYVLHVG